MSTNEYFVSPNMLRELDGVISLLESNILDCDITDYAAMAEAHAEYRGFRMCVQLIRNRSLGLNTESVLDRITGVFDEPSSVYIEEED